MCIRRTECDVMYTLYVMSGPKEASLDGPAVDAVNISSVCGCVTGCPTYYAPAHAQINYQAYKLGQDMAKPASPLMPALNVQLFSCTNRIELVLYCRSLNSIMDCIVRIN